MRIIIKESQLNKIVNEVKLITKSELSKMSAKDTIELNVVGVYGIKDMTEFYNLSPFKTTRKISFAAPSPNDMKTNWRYLTGDYPVVVLKIPIFVAKQKNYMSTHYKYAYNKESYSLTDNEIFIIFVNNGTKWTSKKIWTSKQPPDTLKIYNKLLVNKPLDEFASNLTKIGNLKKYDPTEILSRLSTILNGVPATKKEDIYLTDDVINNEFREPVRFSVRNGDDPKPIIDKIMQKYGTLTKSILDILNSTTIQTLKHKRVNPYL